MKGKMLSLSCVFNLFYHLHFLIPCPISFAINVLSILQIPDQSFVMAESNSHLEVNFMILKLSVEAFFQSWKNRVITLPVLNYGSSSLLVEKTSIILANVSFFLSH